MMRVAVKFCGGCDPAYDRTVYWEAVQERAKGRIDWVSLEESGYEAVLVINGCETACLSEELEFKEPVRVVALKNDLLDPALVIEEILGMRRKE